MTSSQVAFLALLGLVGLSRAGELVLSARRLHGRGVTPVPEPRLLPVMVAFHALALLAPAFEVVALERPVVPAVTAAAAVVLAFALALRVWTFRALGLDWNVHVVVPSAIVVDGPYRWIRHPSYLVVVLEVAGLPLLHAAWVSALVLSVLNAAIVAARIHTEEATLASVPAWREAMTGRSRLIPGLL